MKLSNFDGHESFTKAAFQPDRDNSQHIHKVNASTGQVVWSLSIVALDRTTGAIIWSASVGPGSEQGGIEWGTSNDGRRIFFTESNMNRQTYTLPNGQAINYSSFGAIDATDGRILWQVAEPHGGQANRKAAGEQGQPPARHLSQDLQSVGAG